MVCSATSISYRSVDWIGLWCSSLSYEGLCVFMMLCNYMQQSWALNKKLILDCVMCRVYSVTVWHDAVCCYFVVCSERKFWTTARHCDQSVRHVSHLGGADQRTTNWRLLVLCVAFTLTTWVISLSVDVIQYLYLVGRHVPPSRSQCWGCLMG